MTKLEDVYMLPCATTFNFETISEIREQGYSRIPVYETERSNIQNVLLTKDLMFVDPDDNTPLSTVCEFYQNTVFNVPDVSVFLKDKMGICHIYCLSILEYLYLIK